MSFSFHVESHFVWGSSWIGGDFWWLRVQVSWRLRAGCCSRPAGDRALSRILGSVRCIQTLLAVPKYASRRSPRTPFLDREGQCPITRLKSAPHGGTEWRLRIRVARIRIFASGQVGDEHNIRGGPFACQRQPL